MTSKRDKICAEILQGRAPCLLSNTEQDIPSSGDGTVRTQDSSLAYIRKYKIILDLNQSLLLDLQEADNDSIGGVFLKFAPYLKMYVNFFSRSNAPSTTTNGHRYTAYLNHTEQALTHSSCKEKSNKFRAFCKDQRRL